MVRAPQKSCPSLYKLFDRAQEAQLQAFFCQREFERQEWLRPLRENENVSNIRDLAMSLLSDERKERLKPLEQQAARVLSVTEPPGPFALEGLADTKLYASENAVLKSQKDQLAQSLWAYLNHRLVFEAVEGVLHEKFYRRYGKHYQTFHLKDDLSDGSAETGIGALIAEIEKRLDRGSGCDVHDFDFPSGEGEPARTMYLIYHPKPFASAQDMNEEGHRDTIYFRPPGEATVIHTPSRG